MAAPVSFFNLLILILFQHFTSLIPQLDVVMLDEILNRENLFTDDAKAKKN